eukprot:16079955-Heterocapsa_arctica.AAC.1
MTVSPCGTKCDAPGGGCWRSCPFRSTGRLVCPVVSVALGCGGNGGRDRIRLHHSARHDGCIVRVHWTNQRAAACTSIARADQAGLLHRALIELPTALHLILHDAQRFRRPRCSGIACRSTPRGCSASDRRSSS